MVYLYSYGSHKNSILKIEGQDKKFIVLDKENKNLIKH